MARIATTEHETSTLKRLTSLLSPCRNEHRIIFTEPRFWQEKNLREAKL